MRTRIPRQLLRPCKEGLFSQHPRSSADISVDSSYVKKVLSMNEVSIAIERNPCIAFESNHLSANFPTEDRRFLGDFTKTSAEGTVCFGVIDGHAGHKCAQAVSERLIPYLAVASCKDASLLSNLSPDSSRLGSRITLPGDYIATDNQEMYINSLRTFAESRANEIRGRTTESEYQMSDECIVTAFETLDRHLLDEALKSIGNNRVNRLDPHAVESALSGCCCVTALVDEESITCANVGDSRVVLGHLSVDGTWQAIPLSNEHNADNENERQRILSSHPPQESNTILQHGRLFGSLLPLRAFGDMFFKVSREQMQNLGKVFDISKLKSRSLTPPYLSVTPEITRRKLGEGDKFIIMATDGLWDFIDPHTAVEVIGHHLESAEKLEQTAHEEFYSCGNIHGQEVVRDLAKNGATRLICHAIGQATSINSLPLLSHLDDMIRLPPEYTRENRDDIQVIVVYFK